MNMTIVYCATRNLYHLLPTTIHSLLQNNPNVSQIYVIIEDDAIPCLLHPTIKFINYNNYTYISRSGINAQKEFTYMAMARCVLSKILDENKVLYLDVDTIIDGSLEELWNTSLQDNILAGTRELDSGYFNSGVLLMDLAKIRSEKYDDQLIDLLNHVDLYLPDQDALNIIFRDKILSLPDKFNAMGQAYTWYGKRKIIVRHFAGVIKPWQQGANSQDIAFWNKYATTII